MPAAWPKGDNLLTMSRGEVAGNVLAALPYVNTVQVTRQLPDTLVITVTEYETTFAMTDESGVYYLVTAGGKVAEKVNEKGRQAARRDPGCDAAKPAGRAGGVDRRRPDRDGEDCDDRAGCRRADRADHVRDGRLRQQDHRVLRDRFEVHLGSSERLAYKLEFLKTVIAQQKDYATGSIDLTLSDGDQAHVRLDS